jgi:hypothetical protein
MALSAMLAKTGNTTMLNAARRYLRLSGVVLVAALLVGCGVTDYPALPDLTRIQQKILTPQEQEQAIRDLSEQQKVQEKEAIRVIEGNK